MIFIVKIMKDNTSNNASVDWVKNVDWIERRLEDVNQKIKKNQNVIDNKSTFTGDRPKGILDRIIAI